MNADLAPAVIAAGGGTALMVGIWTYERRRDAAMRASLVRLSLRFPVGLEPLRAFAALDSLSGLPYTNELIFEVAAREGSIEHFLWVPAAVRSSVQATVTGVIGSVRVREAAPSPSEAVTLALRLFIPTPSVLTADSAEEASRALLAGMAGLRESEQVIVRWALRPGASRPVREPEPHTRTDKEIDRVWRRKTAMPGFTVAGLVLVRAPRMGRARELAAHVESVVRSRRGLVGGIRITAGRGNRRLSALSRTARSSGWLSTAELLPLLGWPIGPDVAPGVEVGAARELLVPAGVPRQGRRLFVGRDAVGSRPVALSAEAALHHLAVVGPTGSGKSVVLARGVLEDLARGYGGVLIDPKADLMAEVLDRVPAASRDRVVVLDPAAGGPVPGLDLFGSGDPDLRSEVILSVLREISEGWGPRIDQYLRLGLRTVADLPNPVLSDWLRLYSDAGLRRAAIARVRDPIRIAEWRTYEALSPAEQYQHVAPAISRITTLLARPALRAVLNQPEPKLDIGRLLAERKWLLVSLAPGTLGESAAHLLGAITTYLVWAAIEKRVTIPAAQRRPVFLYFDELQSVSSLPIGLELFFERTRGLGCGVVVATQALERLPESTRVSLVGNVASLITFRAGHDEAARIARELPGLSAQDVMSLGRFEVAARINAARRDSGVAIVTGRTEPLPPAGNQAHVIRARSAEVYGCDPREVERELLRRIEGEDGEADTPLGKTRRAL
jgi:hypothetical protein